MPNNPSTVVTLILIGRYKLCKQFFKIAKLPLRKANKRLVGRKTDWKRMAFVRFQILNSIFKVI